MEEKHENFIAAVRKKKKRNASGHQGENSTEKNVTEYSLFLN